ncbi:MAG: LytTR family DNA-binding domain-containing protein [Bacteroidales bacterium]|jgi:DNA-binding LytR/AlgR family response regulator
MINMPYRVLIIDDEKPARILMEEYVSQMPELTVSGNFSNAMQAAEFLAANEADILLCDIQMPGMNGLDFIRTLGKDVCVIFTTAHSKFAVKGFDLNAVDYLLKPISLERFCRAIDKCLKILQSKSPAPESIYVKADYKLHKIDLDQIVYIQSQHEYVTYYTSDQRITAFGSLKALQSILPEDRFFRIHKSYIVAGKKILTVSRNTIRIKYKGEISLPVGRVYRDKLTALYAHPFAGKEY